MRTILFLIVLALSAAAQQTLEIKDFSGGMVRLYDPYNIPDNAGREMINVSTKAVGGLTNRDGYVRMPRAQSTFRINLSEPKDITEITANYRSNHRALIYHRGDDDLVGPGGEERYTHGYYILKGDDVDTLKFHWVATDMLGTLGGNHDVHSTFWLNNVFLTRKQTPMVIYDGESMYHAAPVGPCEPMPCPVDSIGTLTGCFRYRYVFGKANDGGLQTEPSPESRTVCVDNGKVFVRGICRQDFTRWLVPGIPPTYDTAMCVDSFPYVKVYRKDMLDPDAIYGKVGWINVGDSMFRDDGSAPSATDTLPTSGALPANQDTVPHAPGPLYDTINTCWAAPGSPQYLLEHQHGQTDKGVTWGSQTSTRGVYVAEAIAYVDSAGRWSKTSGFSLHLASTGAGVIDTMYFGFAGNAVIVPRPETYTNVVEQVTIGYREHWDTPDHYDSSYYFITSWPSRGLSCSNCSAESLLALDYPQWQEDDSVLSFDPTDAVIRGSRQWAIGDGTQPNRVWYSSLGRPTTFPFDHYIDIESNVGDWFVRIWALEDALLLFRNNSIELLTGFDFYSFNVKQISRSVGATAISSVDGDETVVFFAHETGIYATTGSRPTRISLPIQTLWDSLSLADQKWAVGKMVRKEYWLSIPNNYTLVFNNDLNMWRKYDFWFDDIIQFVYDSGGHDYVYDYLFVRNDSAFELTDTVATDNGAQVVAEWYSKELFTEDGRVRVNHMDFEGRGSCDSIQVYAYIDNGGPLAVKTLTDVDWYGAVELGRREFATVNRLSIDEIVHTFSFKIKVFSQTNTWLLDKISIDYTNWDEGID